jgi:hypothetical protein
MVSLQRAEAVRSMLASLRMAGGLAYLAPGVAGNVLGLHEDIESRYLTRLFAARNLALTAGLLSAAPEARTGWWRAGVGCDALDALAGVLALRAGKPRGSALTDVALSLLAAGLGIEGLRADRGASGELRSGGE